MPMQGLPLYTAEQARRIDRRAGESFGLPGPLLMQRAGEAAFELLRTRWPEAGRVCVVCGSGNNGGDGLVVARLARAAGLSVRTILVGRGPREGTEAAGALAVWQAAGGTLEPLPESLPPADVYVDAVFGTGLKRAPEGEPGRAVTLLREVAPVLALDVPSGVDADSGHCPGDAVRAEVTLSFIVRKCGLYTGRARNHAGKIAFADLGVPAAAVADETPAAWLRETASPLPPRLADSHKGDNGRVCVIGGAPGFSGAVRMAAEAALRTGAGLVTVAMHPEHAGLLNVGRWELMVRGVTRAEGVRDLIEAADVVVVGPGLATDAWGRALWQAALGARCPLVVDADGLNLLASSPTRRDDWILTPHPGEAGRLLGCDTAAVQADRFAAARRLAERFGGTAVLKGAGTLVQAPQRVTVCGAGNPGMATGGMGDVLGGVIAGLIAQGMAPQAAAEEGVCLHATAGDLAAAEGERGLLATDLYPWLRRLVNGTVR
ncbi:NAD(P)H-hydrate dehydratase [Acidihalobacter aeolianus]